MTRNPWPIAIGVLCGIAFLTAATVVVITVRQRVELVTPDYYARDLAYNKHQLSMANARATPVQIIQDSGARTITVTFPAAAVSGTIRCYRPSDLSMDRVMPVMPADDARQIISTDGLASGLWRIQLAWTQDGRECWQESAVVVP